MHGLRLGNSLCFFGHTNDDDNYTFEKSRLGKFRCTICREIKFIDLYLISSMYHRFMKKIPLTILLWPVRLPVYSPTTTTLPRMAREVSYHRDGEISSSNAYSQWFLTICSNIILLLTILLATHKNNSKYSLNKYTFKIFDRPLSSKPQPRANPISRENITSLRMFKQK